MTSPAPEPEFLTSLWHATAPSAQRRPALVGEIKTDVAIIGGGYAGLSTALHVAEMGNDAVVLEGSEIGRGGSGLNGGQVNPGMRFDPDEIDAAYKPEEARRITEYVSGLPDMLFSLAARLGIECEAARGGFIQPAHSPRALDKIRSRYEQWAQRGAPVRFLDRDAMANLIGTEHYLGGWVDERGGTIHPLKFVRGLASAAEAAGARLFEHSPVGGITRSNDEWIISTSGGTVRARAIAILTNAYSQGLWPRLERSFIPVHSFQIASQPLPDDVAATIPPAGHGISDTRRLLVYFRRGPQNRLLIGGRGTLRSPNSVKDFEPLERVMRNLYPQIGDIPIERRWYGRVAITTDSQPRLNILGPRAISLVGCNGRGVAMFTALGAPLAEWLVSGDGTRLPLATDSKISTIPLHGLNRLYVAAASAYFRMRDWVG